MHVHSWRIESPDGSLSQGVCKGCGARRDFVAAARRMSASLAKPLQELAGNWLAAADEALRIGEVNMPADQDEREAQRIALTVLVRGCDDAVSEMLRTVKARGQQSSATKRAREILAEMLASWRQALAALGPAE